MTGPDHYREAERLLAHADIDARDPMRKYAEDANVIAAAQAHATLAGVAFAALSVATDREAFRQWRDIAGPPRPTITNDAP